MLALAAGSAFAAGNAGIDSSGIDASGNYQSELRSCKEGRTAEDQPTCLREARNAQADKQRGLLNNANGNFEANARARCDALKGDDKSACDARMMGQGEVSGSVAGGGLLRELEIVVPAEVTAQPTTQSVEPVVVVPAAPQPLQ